jgi:hypothetical protein
LAERWPAELRAIRQPHQISGDLDRTANASCLGTRSIELAGNFDQSVVAAREYDRAFGVAPNRLRLDHAAGVDDRIDHAFRGFGGQEHAPAIGGNAAVIGHQRRQWSTIRAHWRLRHLAVQGQRHQPVAVEVEGEGGAGGKADLAQLGLDHPGIGHAGRHEGGEPTLGHGDVALVDDRAALRHCRSGSGR